MFELENSYNKHMEMLSFIIVNEKIISNELFDNYIEKLNEFSDNIVNESNNVKIIIKENKNFLNNIEKEIAYSEALRMFPLNLSLLDC